MFRENLPLFGLLVLLFALFHEACNAKGQSQNCSSSSCGNLLNISFPFQLKGAPHQCGCGGLELDCENNRTSLLVDSVKFYVQEIDYVNQTIRLMDASLHKNTCSIPRLIPNINHFDYSHYYYYYDYYYFYLSFDNCMYLLNCTSPLKSPIYVDVSHCIGNSYSAQTYFYAYCGYLTALDIPQLCSIEGTIPTRFQNATGLSALEIHQELLQGYELRWDSYCDYSQINKKLKYKWFWDSIQFIKELYVGIKDLFLYYGGELTFIKSIGVFILGRAQLGIVCLIAFLIYKFGPGNTFMDDAIEIFLQSHNLMPIRYSYSQIKSMTNGFKDKLGQGGYGTVFKGKLHTNAESYATLSLSLSLSLIEGSGLVNLVSMACPNPLYHLWFFNTQRANLYYLTFIAVLCSFFYLIGLWTHSTTIPIPITSSSAAGAATQCSLQPLIATRSGAVTLDFRAHHMAADPPPTAARTIHLPPCDAKLSEYTPCEDAKRSLKFDRDMLIYRERHCPEPNEVLKCRVPAPHGYTAPFRWPESRENVWYANVPHKWLTFEKKKQNWVRFEKDRFKFPGGGTMFPNGADAYIDDISRLINLNDGSIRTAIDTGCGVASWGAYLLSRNIVTVSFAPRDTHEAQVQFALERGVPALIGVLASIRLPYPSRAFDMAHCSRCLIPWGQYDGLYLIEVDRILRPGGYWILSGPPINWEKHWKGWNRTQQDLKAEQTGIENVAKSLCWKKLKQKDDLAIWQKPTNHIHCKISRKVFKKPQFCEAQDPDKAWYTKMDKCLTPLPEVSDIKKVSGGTLAKWPERLISIPPRISEGTLKGITAETFTENTELWKNRVAHYKTLDYQLAEPGRYRNLLDMNSNLGGFAAALVDDPVWVMNIVPVEAEINTLGVIYERGLIGTYQNWCEAMSTYPRTYDFIHADSVFSLYKDRCDMEDILLEMDRILRPEGSVIFRDDVDYLVKIKSTLDAMQWDSRIVDHEMGPHQREKILLAVKQYWTAPAPQESKNAS